MVVYHPFHENQGFCGRFLVRYIRFRPHISNSRGILRFRREEAGIFNSSCAPLYACKPSLRIAESCIDRHIYSLIFLPFIEYQG